MRGIEGERKRDTCILERVRKERECKIRLLHVRGKKKIGVSGCVLKRK